MVGGVGEINENTSRKVRRSSVRVRASTLGFTKWNWGEIKMDLSFFYSGNALLFLSLGLIAYGFILFAKGE